MFKKRIKQPFQNTVLAALTLIGFEIAASWSEKNACFLGAFLCQQISQAQMQSTLQYEFHMDFEKNMGNSDLAPLKLLKMMLSSSKLQKSDSKLLKMMLSF